MIIKVLGSRCCSNCSVLENNVKTALEKINIEAEVQKITDMAEIISYGVIGTPALIIDDKVVSYGKINSVDEITDFLK